MLVPFTFLRLYFEQYKHKLTFNNNIRGDVEVYFLNRQKIFMKEAILFLLIIIFEGYPQFLSYIQSKGTAGSISSYNFFAFTSHIVFYLSLLFFTELNISKFNKLISMGLFSLLILNSKFLQFLFTTSLMSEGLVSLFTAILVIAALNNLNNPDGLDYKIFLLLGVLYFSKQFNSTLVIILILCLFFIKGRNKIVLLSGVVLKELLFLFVFTEVSKDHHIRQMNVTDTILDLLL